MASISLGPSHSGQSSKTPNQQSEIAEEIEGLIRVYKDGRVERPNIIPSVSVTDPLPFSLTAGDIILERSTHLKVRFYIPQFSTKQPVLVYFHGGGFCVGSCAWSCYHNFLCTLCAAANCVIFSVNYRLAPENRLPAAYEDGLRTVMWLKKTAQAPSRETWWLRYCNLSSLFIGGDSAGANIAFNVVRQLGSNGSVESNLRPLFLKGIILIQPFFGGEGRKMSEQYSHQPSNSALTLKDSDTYWRLALPPGANRDHPWSNPLAGGGASQLRKLKIPSAMVCIAENDILKDRNLEFSAALAKACKRVENVCSKGVGHAFQIFHDLNVSHERKREIMARINAFIHQ